MLRSMISFVATLIAIFILASMPNAILVLENQLYIDWIHIWSDIKSYLSGLLSGDSLHYIEGKSRERHFFNSFNHIAHSFLYLFAASVIAVSLSLFLSLWLSLTKKEWIKDIVGFVSVIPDFIMVLMLQMFVVFIYKQYDFRIARVASRTIEEPAILLPLIIMVTVPLIYLIRNLSEKSFDVMTEDYILNAKAKGLRKFTIIKDHVIRNVLPFLKADLHKLLAIMMSNLFIVEYLFNINGVSSFIFNTYTYQYNLVVNALISLVLIYISIYLLLVLLIRLFGRIFAND